MIFIDLDHYLSIAVKFSAKDNFPPYAFGSMHPFDLGQWNLPDFVAKSLILELYSKTTRRPAALYE